MASPVHKACSLHASSRYPCSPPSPDAQLSTEASRASTTQAPLTSPQSTKAEGAKATRGLGGAGSRAPRDPAVAWTLGRPGGWPAPRRAPSGGPEASPRPPRPGDPLRARVTPRGDRGRSSVAGAAVAPGARRRRAAQTLRPLAPAPGRAILSSQGGGRGMAGTSRRVNSQPTPRGHHCPAIKSPRGAGTRASGREGSRRGVCVSLCVCFSFSFIVLFFVF